MSTKRTLRSRDWRPELSPYQVSELLTGEIVYPAINYSGYGDGVGRDLTAFIGDEMRRDWQQHREALLKFWVSGAASSELPSSLPWLFFYGSPGTRPWAFWELEDVPPADENESENEYLTRCGLWLPDEHKAVLAKLAGGRKDGGVRGRPT
jgi:hypothetical protein